MNDGQGKDGGGVEYGERAFAERKSVEDMSDEEVYAEAMVILKKTKRASTSTFQRRLRIGYTKAAKILGMMEERGVVGPPDGAGPREILVEL